MVVGGARVRRGHRVAGRGGLARQPGAAGGGLRGGRGALLGHGGHLPQGGDGHARVVRHSRHAHPLAGIRTGRGRAYRDATAADRAARRAVERVAANLGHHRPVRQHHPERVAVRRAIYQQPGEDRHRRRGVRRHGLRRHRADANGTAGSRPVTRARAVTRTREVVTRTREVVACSGGVAASGRAVTIGRQAGALRTVPRRTISLPSSQRTNSARAGMRAQPNCRRLMSTVPSSRWKTSIWVTSTARMNSPIIAQFICLLSKVAVVSAVSVSLRHSTAATIRHSANAVNAIELPMAALWKWDLPSSSIVSRPMVMASPARETVVITPVLSTDAPRGRGRSPIRPGVSRSKPSANPNGAFTKKWIHSTWAGENGSPAAMLNRVAPRNVSTNATSSTSTNRMYLVRLS